MNVRVDSISGFTGSAGVIVPIFEGETLDGLDTIAVAAGEALEAAVQGETVAKPYEMTPIYSAEKGPLMLLVGAGKRADLTPLILKRVISAGSRYLTAHGYQELAIVDRTFCEPQQFAQAAVEGALRGSYDPGIRKSEKKTSAAITDIILISTRGGDALDEGIRIGQIVGECSAIARDLVNQPPNELTPSAFAERAQTLSLEYGLECEVIDEDGMRSLGMGSLLGVAAGSHEPARIMVLKYANGDTKTQLALVGKGITFDSGGLSLKTAQGMETMKGDMGGGAAVLAGMVAVARLAPKNMSVTGYIGATENMPGGHAMRPGDILTAMNGETIEVLNTDAEGRLVLADLLAYASKEGATHIVDFATLTGAAVVSLGTAATLATGRPAEWVNFVVEAAESGLERAWAMPIYDEYRRAMDSDIADIKNSGGREGGALNAAAFLRDFVAAPEWAHMDIAGTAFADKAAPHQSSGGTGSGVGTIAGLVLAMTQQNGPAR